MPPLPSLRGLIGRRILNMRIFRFGSSSTSWEDSARSGRSPDAENRFQHERERPGFPLLQETRSRPGGDRGDVRRSAQRFVPPMTPSPSLRKLIGRKTQSMRIFRFGSSNRFWGGSARSGRGPDAENRLQDERKKGIRKSDGSNSFSSPESR